MKNFKLKYKILNWMLLITIGFHLIETVAFLFIDGWHWEASNPYEILCDHICGWAYTAALVLFIIMAFDIMTLFGEAESVTKSARDLTHENLTLQNDILRLKIRSLRSRLPAEIKNPKSEIAC